MSKYIVHVQHGHIKRLALVTGGGRSLDLLDKIAAMAEG